MDLSPATVAKLLLPKTPLIFKTAFLNALSLSQNSKKQDVRTAVTVAILRAFLQSYAPIGRTQKIFNRDIDVKGQMWISKTTLLAAEENDVRDKVARCVKELGDGEETYTLPEMKAVEAEWTGYRQGVTSKEPRPQGSEAEMYDKLMAEVKSDVTTLYFHGGGYMLLDPVGYRQTTSHLARLTGGRTLSVRYRLAPQNPFPAALLDALVAYLSLLSPPPGAPHQAVSADKIIIAGDSAGGNLTLVLLQTLLTLQRIGIPSILFHGKDIPISLPAGIVLNSPWCDLGRTQPSTWDNGHLDYLPVPDRAGFLPSLPADEFWPATPPRLEMFCDASVVAHPLVSPITARSDLWKGAPPVFMCVGSEVLQDEGLVMARRLHGGGATVQLEYYDGMPHVFPLVVPRNPMAKLCWANWADFSRKAVEGTVERRQGASWREAFTMKETRRGWDEITRISDEEVDRKMNEAQRLRVEKEAELRKETGNVKAKL